MTFAALPPQWPPQPQGECFGLLTLHFANTLTGLPVQGQSTVSSLMGPSVPHVNATAIPPGPAIPNSGLFNNPMPAPGSMPGPGAMMPSSQPVAPQPSEASGGGSSAAQPSQPARISRKQRARHNEGLARPLHPQPKKSSAPGSGPQGIVKQNKKHVRTSKSGAESNSQNALIEHDDNTNAAQAASNSTSGRLTPNTHSIRDSRFDERLNSNTTVSAIGSRNNPRRTSSAAASGQQPRFNIHAPERRETLRFPRYWREHPVPSPPPSDIASARGPEVQSSTPKDNS